MNTSVKIVSLGIHFSDAHRRALAAAGCDLQQYEAAADQPAALQAAMTADAVCVSNLWKRHLPADFIGRLERCRLLVVGAAGADMLDADDAALRGMAIANCPGYSAPAVAEHAFALLFSLARKLNRKFTRPQEPGLASHTETAALWKGTELRGKTLGIAGYGLVGKNLAGMASAFGMRVLVAKRNPPWWLARMLLHRNVRFVKFGAMLSQSDAIVSVLPPGARGLFDAEAFSRVRPGCLFVNVGRPQGVDEEALRGALERGTIAGAGLDAVSPMGAQALRALPNVLLSPHSGTNTAEADRRLADECAENLIRFFAGRPVNLIADASRTYQE